MHGSYCPLLKLSASQIFGNGFCIAAPFSFKPVLVCWHVAELCWEFTGCVLKLVRFASVWRALEGEYILKLISIKCTIRLRNTACQYICWDCQPNSVYGTHWLYPYPSGIISPPNLWFYSSVKIGVNTPYQYTIYSTQQNKTIHIENYVLRWLSYYTYLSFDSGHFVLLGILGNLMRNSISWNTATGRN